MPVDQNNNGGQWNLLGPFAFGAGDTKIELKGVGAGAFLFADAVRLVKNGLVQPLAAYS